jgi:hypothetical protein
MPRVDMQALQAQTLAAANKARDLGMISPECFAAMIDGTVSNLDLALANHLVEAGAACFDQSRRTADEVQACVHHAAVLKTAIERQYYAQSKWQTMKESLADTGRAFAIRAELNPPGPDAFSNRSRG